MVGANIYNTHNIHDPNNINNQNNITNNMHNPHNVFQNSCLDPKQLKFLVDNMIPQDLELLLTLSCKKGIIRDVEYILCRIMREMINININNGLCQAIENYHLKIVELLIDHGADINYNNGSPLNLAVKNGYCDIIELLIEKKLIQVIIFFNY